MLLKINMKKILSLVTIVYCMFTSISSYAVDAYLTFSKFNVPGKEPYIETYMSVIGASLTHKLNENGKYQGAVDVSIAFSLDGVIKNAKKYTLNGPETNDTIKGFSTFIDEQRYTLSNGKYLMEITIADKNAPSQKPFITSVPIEINFSDDKIYCSDVQLLESYTKSATPSVITKSGYDLVPYVSTFYPENINQLKFYCEIYNSKKLLGANEKFVVMYSLQTVQTNAILNTYSSFSKQVSNDVNILLSEFNISDLPSGKYKLAIEIKDKENKIVGEQSLLFQRKNKTQSESFSFNDLKAIDVTNTWVSSYKSIDTLSGYIRSLRPISSTAEIQYSENQLKAKKLLDMQQYFYNFWKTRNALQPDVAWNDYHLEVLKVNKEYATYGLKGYDTDKGRVYLQYGAPNIMNKYDNEPSAYPYEIWEYDLLVDKSIIVDQPNNKQTNRRFVFYNPDLVTNKYVLIHSDARGEVYNTRWEMLIHERDTKSTNFDTEQAPLHYGGNADENFNHPK